MNTTCIWGGTIRHYPDVPAVYLVGPPPQYLTRTEALAWLKSRYPYPVQPLACNITTHYDKRDVFVLVTLDLDEL